MTNSKTNKRRRIFIVLFLVILIPILIASRILKHRHIHIEKPSGKIGFHEAPHDKNGPTNNVNKIYS
jgi:hypothetical protein